MATADRGVVVLVKEFQKDDRQPPTLKRFMSPLPQNLFGIKKQPTKNWGKDKTKTRLP